MMNREELKRFRTYHQPVVSVADLAQFTGWHPKSIYNLEEGTVEWWGRDNYKPETAEKYLKAVTAIREAKRAGTWVSEHEAEKKKRKEERKMKTLERNEQRKLRDKEEREKDKARRKEWRDELNARRAAQKAYREAKQQQQNKNNN